jgi:two-component system, OmpR family, sensor histidine kinase BaeS
VWGTASLLPRGPVVDMFRRSISLKLTLAFLVVGLLGAALVAIYVGVRTRSELNRLVSEQESLWIVQALTAYYEETGSWRGIEAALLRRPWRGGAMMPGGMHGGATLITLTNENGVVIAGNLATTGTRLSERALRNAIPLRVDGRIVGHVLLEVRGAPLVPDTPEAAFMQRVQTAILFSGITAALLALVVGGVLARTLMRPIHALTDATHAIAEGDLGRQVEVDGEDELGDLAIAFNQMSRDLARTTAMRRQMTADIAHDLRTPLTVLMGYTEALSDGKLKGSAETYAVMHREAQHLDRLISDLRLLSLVDAGELPLNRVRVAPQALLERAAAAYVVQAQEKGVRMVVEAPARLPLISVDPELLARVLNNLVTNALRYTPEGGTIMLRAEAREAHRIALVVEDTGTGIAAEDLPHVFDRFYRGDRSRQGTGESGLGLAIVRSLVEAHGGSVAVESAPGQGARFTVTLPAAV